jgi:hypothetical protein
MPERNEHAGDLDTPEKTAEAAAHAAVDEGLDATRTGATALLEMPKGQYVSPAEFRSLATSHRSMVREDDSRTGMRGLRDLATGELFVIEERILQATPVLKAQR